MTADLGRCLEKGCPFRWRDGVDRPCSVHDWGAVAGGVEVGPSDERPLLPVAVSVTLTGRPREEAGDAA